MDSSVWSWLLVTWTICNSLLALYVLGALRLALRSTLTAKSLNSIRTDFAELQSDFTKLFELTKKLSKRQALADYKAGVKVDASSNDALSKDELRKKYLHNRSHADVARLAMRGEV